MMKKESGFVLVTGVIFLVVLTIMVIYMLRGSILQERMTGNSIDRQRALQAADAVLREAEQKIVAGGAPFDPLVSGQFSNTCPGANGLCKKLNDTVSLWTSISWSNLSGMMHSTMGFHGESKVYAPYYVIELVQYEIGPDGKCIDEVVFRVTAKGVGKTGAEAVLQTDVRTPPPKKCY